jgi:response regulator RpfG family c-di-GMP phosphodiesterase
MNGSDGMQAVFAERPDLVLLDLNMPHQTGGQFYRQMCLEEACKNIPVIFITGMPDSPIFDQECAPLPQPAARFDKPIDLGALKSAIRNVLGGVP